MALVTSSRRTRGDRGSAALVAVLGLLALAIALSLLTLSASGSNMKHTTQAKDDVDLHFLAMSALNQAYAEVENQSDYDGYGGIGAVSTVTYTSSTGATLGQYATYVYNTADPDYSDPNQAPNYVIRVMVAVPSFANPLLTRTAEGRIQAEPVFALTPKVGAVSIAGPLTSNPSLSNWNSSSFTIDGGTAPGIVFTDENSRASLARDSTIDDGWFSNGLDSKVTGSPLEEFARTGTPSTFNAPFTIEEDAAFTAEMLNGYRDALREYAHDLVHATDADTDGDGYGDVSVDYSAAAGDGVVVLHQEAAYIMDGNNGAAGVQPKIKAGTHTFTDKVVLIDTSQFMNGGQDIAENHADGSGGGPGTTITGSGTLVLLHPIGSRTDNNNGKNFNLDWDGDVIIVGYPEDRSGGTYGGNADTDNLLYISRADWEVDGNLIVLTQGATEASLEMQGTNTNPATLTVNGALLMFGEAGTQESEIDIESHAQITVNGLLAAFGSRLEIENASSTNTSFQVNGTLAMGFPEPEGTKVYDDDTGGLLGYDSDGDGDVDVFARYDFDGVTDDSTRDIDGDGDLDLPGLPKNGHFLGFDTDGDGDVDTRSDDLTWQVNGNADFNFNLPNVESAIAGLAELQSNLNLSDTDLESLDFEQRATVTRSTASVASFQADYEALVNGGLAIGVDVDLIVETAGP